MRGEQCRRASGPSRHAMCRRPAPPLHRRSHRRCAAPPRRLSQRAIELVGIVLAIGFVAAVALGHELSNDEFWSLAAGQWMLAHHAIMGLDPFSYTESHRRWVTDEWGSELTLAALFRAFGQRGLRLYADRARRVVPRGQRGLCTRPRRARRAGGRHRPAARGGHRRRRGGGPGARLLAGVVPARVARAHQGADQSTLALPPPVAVRRLGQHARVDPARALRARGGAGVVARAGPVGRADRRRAPVALHRFAGPGAAGQRGRLVHHPLRPGALGLRRRRGAQHPDRAVHQRVELTGLPLGDGACWSTACRWPCSWRACGRAASPCSRGHWR